MGAFLSKISALILACMMTLGVWAPESMEIDNVPLKNEDAIRVVSFNLRCANDIQGSVKNRSKLIVLALKQYHPDSFGVQEATAQWIQLLEENLSDEYGVVYQMRDKSKSSEASAVFYLRDKYNLLNHGTIWLSETPEKENSKSFYSMFPRVATWAELENKENGEKYTHINTHLDHMFECTRVKQVQVLLDKIRELKAEGEKVICTGDFNSKEGAKAYEKMKEDMLDTKYLALKSDEGNTFHNYGTVISETRPIDFIFVSEETKVDTYKIIDEKISGLYLSDHYGICADFYI